MVKYARLVLTMVFLLILVAPAPVLAAPPPAPQATSIPPDELEAFLDEFFATQMAETNTPGVVIVFVQDGQILLSKGYGLANVEETIPMDVGQTVVSVGSISKLFVATAVMQLAEQGRLDLHADVNQYLTTFQVDATFPEPVTLAHLLTHTAGLDEAWDTSTDPSTIPPLETYLAGKIRRILPPGEVWYYSGVGAALAAYIVETVSGMPFDRYVAENILQPLGMAHSRYLLAPPLPDGLATGYLYQDQTYLPQPVEYYGDYPSSDMVSTADDMARFMIAHLGNGCYDKGCILRPETLAEMHARQYAPHPQIEGHTYGFVESSVNGQRIIGHSGAHRGFGAILTLMPEHRLGYFMAFNQECLGTSACAMISALQQQFADRFFPATPPALPAPAPATPLEQVTGTYRQSLYLHNPTYQDTIWKLGVLEQDVTVEASGDGIMVGGVEYVEITPLLFEARPGGKRLAFMENDRGEVAYMWRPPAYEKVAWYATSNFQKITFWGWGALWAGSALTWPAALLFRRWRGRQPVSRLEYLAHGLLVLMGVLNVAFLVSLIRLFWISAVATRAWLVLPLVSAGLTMAALALAGIMRQRKTGTTAWRVYHALVVLLSVVFLLMLNAWNLIGFKLD